LDGDNNFFMSDCNEGYTIGSSAFISAIILMGGNTYLVTIFRCHRFWAVQVTYVITVVSCLLAAYVSPRFEQSTVIISQSLLLIIIYWNMELSNYTIFRTLLDAEAHRRQQTDELKRFIGNVSIIIVFNYTQRR
jgi:cell shape-determining protein MreD